MLLAVSCCGEVCAQQDDTSNSLANIFPRQEQPERNYDLPPGTDPQNELVVPFLKHLAQDQKHFWTLPTRAKKSDLKWILPVAAGTAGLFAADDWISKQVPDKPNQINRSLNISDYALYSLIGAGGGAFILGHISHNDHLRETGLLSAEAAINATGVAYFLKLATERQRPYTGTGEEFGEGEFLTHSPSGSNFSFPSEHSAIAWSIASVVAHEYPGPLTKFAAYGLATAVSLTRVTARQHFVSDVAVGGVLGWYFGHEVYKAHHDPELGGEAWGNFYSSNDYDEPRQREPRNMSSPYVPPDSWVYPMFDRLAALGFVKTGYFSPALINRIEAYSNIGSAF